MKVIKANTEKKQNTQIRKHILQENTHVFNSISFVRQTEHSRLKIQLIEHKNIKNHE